MEKGFAMRHNPLIRNRISQIDNRISTPWGYNPSRTTKNSQTFIGNENIMKSTLKRIISNSNLKQRSNRNHCNTLNRCFTKVSTIDYVMGAEHLKKAATKNQVRMQYETEIRKLYSQRKELRNIEHMSVHNLGCSFRVCYEKTINGDSKESQISSCKHQT